MVYNSDSVTKTLLTKKFSYQKGKINNRDVTISESHRITITSVKMSRYHMYCDILMEKVKLGDNMCEISEAGISVAQI